MISVYVDSAPGTFDQSVEKNGQQRFQTDTVFSLQSGQLTEARKFKFTVERRTRVCASVNMCVRVRQNLTITSALEKMKLKPQVFYIICHHSCK